MRRMRVKGLRFVSVGVLFILSLAVSGVRPLCAGDLTVVRKLGAGRVTLVQYEDGRWQLFVDDEMHFIQGVEYSPDPVGVRPAGSNEWMTHDFNQNGLVDGPYEAWVDRNGNNYQDPDEDGIGDFSLMREMGVNTIRVYHPSNIDRDILRDLYENYGISVIMGNLVGAYGVGSGADWETGTDYTDPEQCANMTESVRQMVLDHKDEPYVLMWMLGNENDVEGSAANSTLNNTNAASAPAVYAEFIGGLCRMIKEIDPDHPVGVSNASYRMLPYYAKHAPEIDVVGMNAYSGPFGFGVLWSRIKSEFDRPVLITEYGTDCYNQLKGEMDEDYQADYHWRSWMDIENNSFWGNGVGNAIGGVAFCWLDKWWLCGLEKVHDTEAGAWKGPTMDGWFNDEWLGICGQGTGLRSPFQRHLRQVYFLYRDFLWNLPGETGE